MTFGDVVKATKTLLAFFTTFLIFVVMSVFLVIVIIFGLGLVLTVIRAVIV